MVQCKFSLGLSLSWSMELYKDLKMACVQFLEKDGATWCPLALCTMTPITPKSTGGGLCQNVLFKERSLRRFVYLERADHSCFLLSYGGKSKLYRKLRNIVRCF